MLSFYKQAALVFIALFLFSLLLGFASVERTFLNHRLLPDTKSVIPWTVVATSDVIENGTSTVSVNDHHYSLDFDFQLKKAFEHPYISSSLNFAEGHEKLYVDLSAYNTLSFSIKCKPHNVLSIFLHVFDEKISKPGDLSSYRLPTTFFSCDEEWTQVDIDLTRMEIPDWWLWKSGLEISDKAYRLEHVSQINFASSSQSPHDINVNVKVDELTLRGRDWSYLYVSIIFLVLMWSGFIFYFFRWHTKALIEDLKDKLQKDRPLVAYQQLSVEPQRDKEKSAILSFMATEYANADLNLEMAVSKLAVSRTKINEILKEELGLTFTAYLNKLRLTEAARLLSEKNEANIAEIAYSVGYKNVPYFNKLFKGEYNCTPKTFKNIYKK